MQALCLHFPGWNRNLSHGCSILSCLPEELTPQTKVIFSLQNTFEGQPSLCVFWPVHLTRKESLASLQSGLPKELATLDLALSSNLPSLACPDIMFHTLASTGKEVHKKASSFLPCLIQRCPPCPQKPGFHWPPSTSSRESPPPPPLHLRHTRSPAIRYPPWVPLGLVWSFSNFAYWTISPPHLSERRCWMQDEPSSWYFARLLLKYANTAADIPRPCDIHRVIHGTVGRVIYPVIFPRLSS